MNDMSSILPFFMSDIWFEARFVSGYVVSIFIGFSCAPFLCLFHWLFCPIHVLIPVLKANIQSSTQCRSDQNIALNWYTNSAQHSKYNRIDIHFIFGFHIRLTRANYLKIHTILTVWIGEALIWWQKKERERKSWQTGYTYL